MGITATSIEYNLLLTAAELSAARLNTKSVKEAKLEADRALFKCTDIAYASIRRENRYETQLKNTGRRFWNEYTFPQKRLTVIIKQAERPVLTLPNNHAQK